MTWLQRFLSILYPATLVCLVEAAAVVTWGGVERPYLPRLAGFAVIVVLAAGAVAALLLARFPLESPRAWLALSWGTVAALSTAMVLANGAPPRFAPGDAAPPVATVLLGGTAVLAALVRLVLPRPIDRSRALLLEPLLLASALAGAYALAGRLGLPTGALRTILPWAALLLAVIGACTALTGRGRPDRPMAPEPSARWRERLANADGSTRAALSLVLWTAALAAAAAALGRAPFEPMRPKEPGGSPDVLLVVLDTVRADVIAQRLPATFFLPDSVSPSPGHERRPAAELAHAAAFGTPNLAGLAAGGLRFPNAFSTSCWTLPAHASLFTGMEAATHGVGWANPHLPAALPSLPVRLSLAGRRTVGLSANPWITPEFGFDRGFERFVAADLERRPWIPWAYALVPPLARAVDGTLLWEDKDGFVLASEAVRALSRANRPAFVFVNLMEAHLPYSPPRRVLERGLDGSEIDLDRLLSLPQDPLMDLRPGFVWSPSHLAGLRALYAAEVSYLDELLGRVLERLRQSGRLPWTQVIVVADHGENLGEHPPLDHQLGLWDTLVRVPFIAHLPGAGAAARGEDPRLVSLADVPDAIEAWAQGSAPPTGALPLRDAVHFDYDTPSPILQRIESRLAIDSAPWARALTGIRTASGKWVLSSDGLHEGAAAPSDTALEALRGRLRSLGAARAPAPPLPPEAAGRLRSLGYVQ